MEISTVLMVDDDPSISRIAELVLSRVGGWKVTLAPSGKEALKALENFRPDVILLDVMMPEMDGPTTFSQIRDVHHIDVPVIFMTAKVQRHEVDGYKAIGAAGVITKPFDAKSLPDSIKSIVEAWEKKDALSCA
jgi:two-component system, OmpR family, response regulator